MLLIHARRIVAEARREELVTIEMLANIALVAEKTIRRDIAKGALRVERVGGRMIRIRGDEAHRYIYGATNTTTNAS